MVWHTYSKSGGGKEENIPIRKARGGKVGRRFFSINEERKTTPLRLNLLEMRTLKDVLPIWNPTERHENTKAAGFGRLKPDVLRIERP